MTPRDKIGLTLEAAQALEPRRGTRKNCTFRQRDLAAALRAAKQTGHEVSEIQIEPDGRIRITTGMNPPAEPVLSETKQAEKVWLDLARKRG